MNRLQATAKHTRRSSHRLAAPMVIALTAFLASTAAWAARVENTAQVSYSGDHGIQTVHSNTVAFDIVRRPAAAQIGFRRYDSGPDGNDSVATDGGQCRVGSTYVPIPATDGTDGQPVDPAKTGTSDARGYYVGEPVVVTVSDANRNLDPDVRELIELTLDSTTGDAESVQLLETGPDTGVFAAAIQSRKMSSAATQYDCVLSLEDAAEVTARYADSDFPLDVVAMAVSVFNLPTAEMAVLRLEQQVSRRVVEVGDFVQYTMELRNIHDAPAFSAWMHDVLPPGVRYRAGSLRVSAPAGQLETGFRDQAVLMGGGPTAVPATPAGGSGLQVAPDPLFGADGRSFRFPVGTLAAGASVTATFVAEVGPAARGPELVSMAHATAAPNVRSNDADAVMRMEKSLATSAFTIVGRVLVADSCEVPAGQREGVPNVRVLLEDGTYVSTDADGAFHFEGVRPGTHVAQLDTATLPEGLAPAHCVRNTRHAGRAFSQFVEAQGGMLVRADFFVVADPSRAAEGKAALSPGESAGGKPDIASDVAAAGGDTDWLAGQPPGRAWLFPAEDYNPRTAVTRVVIKRLPSDRVALRINGEEVSGLAYDGSLTSPSGVAASVWRSVHLEEGDNLLEATVTDGNGQVVAELARNIHFAVDVARAQFLPERSLLVADGLRRPMIAVRMLDRFGKPARHGMSGEYSVTAPYAPAVEVGQEQSRKYAGLERATPTWRVEGDEGIAWIELEPTTVAGSFSLGFNFGTTARTQVHQDIEGWLKAEARDWIVVGFAKGSVGYETLADNMQALPGDEDGAGVRGDGQVSLYAKGRVLGDWLLTLAYDNDRSTDDLRRRGLLSTIDPSQYYTLYGDGTRQGYDAASASKLYLKLEREQFYALFGDFQTGLDDNQLSRYQRTLNGIKVEYHGPLVEFNGFAARTAQNYARDELPGDGTSGLYRLSHAGILMNTERVRLETRDRFHSEQILETRDLQRHIDYDIDYDNGTLFFREPIASRDFDLNPNFIVVEYETRGTGEEYLNAGGRAGVRLMDGRLEAGVSYIRDEDIHGRSRLAGVDARFRLTPNDELRAEAARTRGEDVVGDVSGSAWLLEWEHRGERFNLLAYARRQGVGFGLGQQNQSEAGMAKAGVQGQWRVGERFSLQGEAYRLESLASGTVRKAARAQLEYQADDWRAKAGLQWARDEAPDGKVAESRQVTVGASRFLLDHKLEVSAEADLSLGGSNDSVDFPTRFKLGAAYAVNQAFRLLAAHEITDGEQRDTATTRFGFEATPWANAKLSSTLNQSQISEYGPRTFALFGLDQHILLNERWSIDLALDSSHAFNESGELPLIVDPAQPIAIGGIRDGGALTEDFTAVSAGATYRNTLWSWNVRMEAREGESSDRKGFTSAFLRQVRDGVALSASLQAFSQDNADGSTGLLANAQLSWAYRPLGSRWSMLDKLEFRLDEITHGQGVAILGQDTLATIGNARSRRLVNNFVLNYASDAWANEDSRGVLALDQRSEFSLYYGSKYVLDTFDGDDYSGYTDIIGAEWRFDLTPRVDIGLRASVLHSWSQDTYAWAFGPSVGFSPFTNAWVSLGYNTRGFQDRDFEDTHHTAEGPYLVFRMKFDQHSLGLAGDGM